MTKNYMKEVAKLLGVELDEEFLIDDLECKFKININGLYFYQNKEWCCSMNLPDLLTGTATIKKLPWKPQFHEYFYSLDIESRNVTYRKWFGTIADYALLALGMVYRTKEEAEANLSKDYEKLTGKPLSTVE